MVFQAQFSLISFLSPTCPYFSNICSWFSGFYAQKEFLQIFTDFFFESVLTGNSKQQTVGHNLKSNNYLALYG